LYFALHVLFVSHETFCFYQTVYIFIYSAYKLQVCSLNFCSLILHFDYNGLLKIHQNPYRQMHFRAQISPRRRGYRDFMLSC